jgi:predicted nucleic acid-binding protein
MILDTSGLISFFDQSDARNEAVIGAVAAAKPPFVVSPYVIAELDHILRQRAGHRNARTAMAELAGGGYELACLKGTELARALEIDRLYGDFDLGITDASLVVLAARYDTLDLLTFDQRHFRKVTPIQGGAFRLLPLDA